MNARNPNLTSSKTISNRNKIHIYLMSLWLKSLLLLRIRERLPVLLESIWFGVVCYEITFFGDKYVASGNSNPCVVIQSPPHQKSRARHHWESIRHGSDGRMSTKTIMWLVVIVFYIWPREKRRVYSEECWGGTWTSLSRVQWTLCCKRWNGEAYAFCKYQVKYTWYVDEQS